jgi:hypothetical protein
MIIVMMIVVIMIMMIIVIKVVGINDGQLITNKCPPGLTLLPAAAILEHVHDGQRGGDDAAPSSHCGRA